MWHMSIFANFLFSETPAGADASLLSGILPAREPTPRLCPPLVKSNGSSNPAIPFCCECKADEWQMQPREACVRAGR